MCMRAYVRVGAYIYVFGLYLASISYTQASVQAHPAACIITHDASLTHMRRGQRTCLHVTTTYLAGYRNASLPIPSNIRLPALHGLDIPSRLIPFPTPSSSLDPKQTSSIDR
ncbi:hypothetical protein F4802DRAFT_302220 [Xylaria palmicola]|nr:hypothetical protein F4802DRAFT_302220 [Xylaria palmicola]